MKIGDILYMKSDGTYDVLEIDKSWRGRIIRRIGKIFRIKRLERHKNPLPVGIVVGLGRPSLATVLGRGFGLTINLEGDEEE